MRLVSIVAACCVLSVSMSATSFIATDLSELTREARTIARGRVVSVDSRWSADRSRIETLVTLEAETYMKGALGTTLQFVVPGGRLGRYRSILVGAPSFEPGQRVIVFLAASAPSLPHVIGLSQGLFRVVPDADRWLVTPQPVVSAAASRIVRGDPARQPMTLADFEQQVRTLAGSAR